MYTYNIKKFTVFQKSSQGIAHNHPIFRDLLGSW